MKNYRKGRTYEIEVAEIFRAAGYDVSLSTMSKGIFDFVATKTTDTDYKKTFFVVLGQCKIRKRNVKVKE